MVAPLSWTILVNLSHCPIFGAHYSSLTLLQATMVVVVAALELQYQTHVLIQTIADRHLNA
jgi:hypothetical protein